MPLLIGSSAFDAVHERPTAVYNRAAIELVAAVLFENTFAVTPGALIDSPVLLTILGEMQKSAPLTNGAPPPFRVFIDPERHFRWEGPTKRNTVGMIAASYLSGMAQTGQNLWKEGLTDPTARAKLSTNFRFIKYAEQLDRGLLIEGLIDGNLDRIQDYISDEFLEWFEYLNSYFSRAKTVEYNENGKISYEEDLKFSVKSHLKNKSFRLYRNMTELMKRASDSGYLTRGQLFRFRSDFFDEDEWKSKIRPFLNFHYNSVIFRGYRCNVIRSVEPWEMDVSDGLDVGRATVPDSQEQQPIIDIVDEKGKTGECFKTFDRRDRIVIPWDEVYSIKNEGFRKFAKKLFSEEYEDALIQYSEFAANKLHGIFDIEDFHDGILRFAVKGHSNHGLIHKTSFFTRPAVLTGACLVSGFANTLADPILAGSLASATGFSAGPIMAKLPGGSTSSAVRRTAEVLRDLGARHLQPNEEV